MLCVIHPDLSAEVFVNEGGLRLRVRAAKALQAGEAVYEEDIVDIEALEFPGAGVPADAGVACVLSAGWRKGFFFDVSPFVGDRPPRDYDLSRVLGSFFAYLLNQAVFNLQESHWGTLFKEGWFPFVSLPKRILRPMISAVKSGSSPDQYVTHVVDAIKGMARQMRSRWAGPVLFQEHLPLLERAMDRFLEGDHVSATSILYPRIEGILRAIRAASGGSQFGQSRLAQAAVEGCVDRVHEYSWLLPNRFKEYLETVYFANFSPGQPAPLSRHSVGHGVAQAQDFDKKHACIALLIVDQLRFLLPLQQSPGTLEPASYRIRRE
jgi:hypothetical protein